MYTSINIEFVEDPGTNIKTYNFDALYDDWFENTPEAKALRKKMARKLGMNPNATLPTKEEEDEWTEKYSARAIERQWSKEFNTFLVKADGVRRYERILATPELDKYVKDLNLVRALANKKDFKPKYEKPYRT